MKLRTNMLIALLAAALCVLGPWSVPLGPIPVTLATLGVYLAAGLLGHKRGTAAVGLYVALGALGLPVFSGFSGGVQRLVGVTGGYIAGYILCALLAGWLLARCRRPWMVPLALAAGTLALYTLGTLWYLLQAGGTIGAALLACVVPFLPGDGAKIVAATAVILPLRGKMDRLLEVRHPN